MPHPILTAGYEGRPQEGFFDSLVAAGTHTLLDVRAVPLSRRAGFSKTLLAAGAAARGITYIHLQKLGTPKDGRIAARAGRTAEMTRIFAAHMATEAAQDALLAARQIVTAAPTCLVCFEADHRGCHRTILAGLLAAQTGQTIENL